MLQHIVNDEFHHIFCQSHVILQVCEGDLRLDHPELRRVAGCVGILCAEGRSECIDIAEGHRIGLAVKLAADGQVDRLAEEVLAVVHAAILFMRNIGRIQGCNPEHLAGTFRVTGGDDGRMHIYKIPLLEEFVNCIRDQGTNAEYCLEGIGSRTQMADCTQILHGMALGLQRVIRCRRAFYVYAGGLNLERLLRSRCRYERTGHDHSCADI